MTRRLHTIDLPKGALWTNRFQTAAVRGAAQRTTAGGIVLQTQSLQKGRAIRIEFPPEFCALTFTEVLAYQQIGDVAGGNYLFIWDSVTERVVFDPKQPYQFDPRRRLHEAEHDRYTGTLNLITV